MLCIAWCVCITTTLLLYYFTTGHAERRGLRHQGPLAATAFLHSGLLLLYYIVLLYYFTTGYAERRALREHGAGAPTQCTCVTRTKVQILTPEERAPACHAERHGRGRSRLLLLLLFTTAAYYYFTTGHAKRRARGDQSSCVERARARHAALRHSFFSSFFFLRSCVQRACATRCSQALILLALLVQEYQY